MSPERRERVIDALVAIHSEFPHAGDGAMRFYLASLSDAELTVMIASIEAQLERAMGTETGTR